MSVVLSILAILISGGSLWFAVSSFRRSHRIEVRQLEIEEAREADKKKAYLVADVFREELARRAGDRIIRKYYLLVENRGLAEAHDVTLSLGGKPLSEQKVIDVNQTEVRQVGPSSSFKYELLEGYTRHFPLDVGITWEDDSEDRGSYRTTLTL